MAIVRKKFGNRVYLYDVVCKRVDGKPRIVSQRYLGKPEDVLGTPREKPGATKEGRIFDFGAIAALLDIARELGLVELIDQAAGKRQQGPSVGEYILLAALNRAVAPTSKRRLGDWYRQSVLWRQLGFRPRQLSSQRFWDNLSRLTRSQIETVEQKLNEILVTRWGLDLTSLIYDTTNFYSYISTQTKAQLPQRGHNKQRRMDLRQVSLALVVTRDGQIPLFHQVYEGNQTDTQRFGLVIKDLRRRYELLARGCDAVTLVFDKGNNSQANQTLLAGTPYHFIGSLVPTQHRELLAIPRRDYQPVPEIAAGDWLAYRTRRVVFGVQRTVIVTFNPEFYEAQLRGVLWTLNRCEMQLTQLGRHPGRSEERLKSAAQKIVARQYVREILGFKIEADERGCVLYWWRDEAALTRIRLEQLGKKILFTDNDGWSTAAIISGYHGQYQIEHAFRQMKSTEFVSWWPMFHRTDQKIMVHGFYCVLALLLVALLRKRVRDAGIEVSTDRLLTTLAGIREIECIRLEGRAAVRSEYVLTQKSPEEERLYQLLRLERYAWRQMA